MGAQKDKWLILTAGDLEVTLKDEHSVDRQGKGSRSIYHLSNNRKEEAAVLKQFSYRRTTYVS